MPEPSTAERAPRLGILGGTFDPIHVGHLVTAVNVRHALSLDRVILMVANVPWQKEGQRSITPAADRLAMVEAAVAGVHGLDVGRLEIERGGPSYTADTLRDLTSRLVPSSSPSWAMMRRPASTPGSASARFSS
ncbi:MAG: nicotinate-nicotinamide nucleotide adenylyltransferase [Ilumatobacteraceae bacterium]